MGGKVAKSSVEKCDYSSQRIFLCEHCYQKNNINADSSICRNCGSINLNVCFYPFSEPIIPVQVKPKKQLFQDSFESLYANINCCGIIKRTDEKSFSFAEHEVPPNITCDDLLNSNLGGDPIPALQIQQEQRFLWMALLNQRRESQKLKEVSVDVSLSESIQGNPLSCKKQNVGIAPTLVNPIVSIDSLHVEPTTSIRSDIDSIPAERDPLPSIKLNKSCAQLQETPITCTKQEVGTSISQEDLSLMSIHVGMGNSNEDANSQHRADSITIQIGPQEMDCFDDWENISELMIDFPSPDKEFQSPTNMSTLNTGVTISASRNWDSKEPNHCIMKIVNGNNIHILLQENVNEICEIKKAEDMENYCRERLQDGILDAAPNNKINQEIRDPTGILNSCPGSKQADCEDVMDAQRKCPYQVTEDILFKQKLLNNDVNRFMLPSIINDESFYRISLNEHENCLTDDGSLTMWASSFENILQLCHCNQQLLDVEVYNFGTHKDVKLASYPQTYIARNTTKTQMELSIPEMINQKHENNYIIDQDDINKNIPLQLQGAFPQEGAAFFPIANLGETSKSENNAHSEQVVKLTFSESSLSLVEEIDDFIMLKKVILLVENIIDELLPYFSIEIIQEFKTLGNPWLLDILMTIIRDLKTARCIIHLFKDLPYRLIGDCNYLVKVQKILAKVINGLEKLEKQKMYWPKMVQSKEIRHYDFNMGIFESLKPSVNTLPITRRKSEPLLLAVNSAIVT